MTTYERVVEIIDERDVARAINVARFLAMSMRFSTINTSLLLLAISELTTNIVKYASPGYCRFSGSEIKGSIKVVVEDHGPGIQNIEQAMKDGFSTSEVSLGLGLGAVRRAVNHMEIQTSDQGTRITIVHSNDHKLKSDFIQSDSV